MALAGSRCTTGTGHPRTIREMTAAPVSPGGTARRSGRSRRLLLVGGGLTAAGAATAASVAAVTTLRRRIAAREASDGSDGEGGLGWGGLERPDHFEIRTRDGAVLAVWDLAGPSPEAPVVVLPHCWGCSHEIWLPVTRRLVEQGHRVVLYDQRGHGFSSRGTAPLRPDTLGHDLATVLEMLDVRDAVLAGHSMGGMTIMSLASTRPALFHQRTRATVLVATSATAIGGRSSPGTQASRAMITSPLVSRALKARNGHVFVRSVFGVDPERAHLELTSRLFADCDRVVRGDLLVSFASLDLLEGIAGIRVPTTVLAGERDPLTVQAKADQIAGAIPGARLVTLRDRGHMLPLEDPEAVTSEIVRAFAAADAAAVNR